MMNNEQNGLEPTAGSTPRPEAPAAREAYATPRLTSYGRVERLTGTGFMGDNDEAILAEGATD